jgi:octaprenyl-diphosphate synthase
MSDGELLQMEKTRSLNINESTYYEIIKCKTASLLASACAAGAATTFQNEQQVEQMRLFGEKVGMAFQIKDGLFDYGSNNVRKPTGHDIKEKKLTLPLIYTLNNCSNKQKREIIYILKNENKNKTKVQQVINWVNDSGGIEYTVSVMNQFRDEALAILFGFPQSETCDALEEMVRYTTDRKD